MRAFLIACLAILVIAIGAIYVLGPMQQTAGLAYVGAGARVDPKWSWRMVGTEAGPMKASEARADDCGVRSVWAMIRADFSSTRTADPLCEH
jgi:hypothetical protein